MIDFISDFVKYKLSPVLDRFDLESRQLNKQKLLVWLYSEIMRLGYPGNDHIFLDYDKDNSFRHGFWRTKDGYPETLLKKYKWIAFHRLIGMLEDNLPRANAPWKFEDIENEIVYMGGEFRLADLTDIRDFDCEVCTYPQLQPKGNDKLPSEMIL